MKKALRQNTHYAPSSRDLIYSHYYCYYYYCVYLIMSVVFPCITYCKMWIVVKILLCEPFVTQAPPSVMIDQLLQCVFVLANG